MAHIMKSTTVNPLCFEEERFRVENPSVISTAHANDLKIKLYFILCYNQICKDMLYVV